MILRGGLCQIPVQVNKTEFTGLCEKVPAKFGEESSVKADGLCIGCLSQWAEVGRENSNMQEFFCTTLYWDEGHS